MSGGGIASGFSGGLDHNSVHNPNTTTSWVWVASRLQDCDKGGVGRNRKRVMLEPGQIGSGQSETSLNLQYRQTPHDTSNCYMVSFLDPALPSCETRAGMKPLGSLMKRRAHQLLMSSTCSRKASISLDVLFAPVFSTSSLPRQLKEECASECSIGCVFYAPLPLDAQQSQHTSFGNSMLSSLANRIAGPW